MEDSPIFIDFHKLMSKLKERVQEEADYQRETWKSRAAWVWENRSRLCERGMLLLIILIFCRTLVYHYLADWFGQVMDWDTVILEQLEDQLWKEYPQCRASVRGAIRRGAGYEVSIWIRASTREFADEVAQCAEEYLGQPDIMQAAAKDYLERFPSPEYTTLDFLTIYVDVDAGNQRAAEVDISCPEVS